MGNVLIIAEHADGKIKKSALSAIAFGKQVAEKIGGADVHLLMFGNTISGLADQIKTTGIKEIHMADNAGFEHYQNEVFAPVVEQVAKAIDAEMVAAAASTMTKDLMPKVAAMLDAAMISEAMAVNSASSFKRPMWAGNAIATVEVSTPIKVATIRATEFEPVTTDQSDAVVTNVDGSLVSDVKCKFDTFDAVKSERPDLTEASIVVSGGRGCKGEEGMKVIEELADHLNAAVGWTRAVVDAGWAPNDLQVGQTGKIVAPDLYIAVALSGAIQHLAGMKGSKTIVAINKDPEAPIFQVADYGLVGDMFKAVPELLEEIKKAQAS